MRTLEFNQDRFRPLQVRKMMAGALWVYKAVFSGVLGNHCRFYPSCSVYMAQAVERYGYLRGVLKGVCRLGRCHPFHPGGVDLP